MLTPMRGKDLRMIRCKQCGENADRFAGSCAACGAEYSFTRLELEDSLDEARAAIKKRDYEYAVTIYSTLADKGVTEAEREYGAILEKGSIVPRDIDLAMKYFHAAAKKNDPYSAYRFSKLAARTSDKASAFWLCYSAILGAREAFPAVAEAYSEMGDEEAAGYYYALAADGADVDSIVTMAKRYYNGVGTEKNEAYAKWYMDKLTLPPFHALRLAYKLRGVKAEMPPEPTFPGYTALLRSLMRDAKKYELHSAHLHLARMLAKDGTPDSLFTLGQLLAENANDGSDIEEAVRTLEAALRAGSAEASKYLGDLYAAGKVIPRDIDKALSYYEISAGAGHGGAYEVMGDMFREGRIVETNIAYAIDLYDRGAREGDANCRRKSEELRDKREECFARARSCEKEAPDTAFEFYGLSTAMGYLPAHRELARCFENGIGTKKNRRMAFMWYKLAVDHGDNDALFDLGRCYAYGIGVPFNFEKAIEILTRSKRYGSRAAETELIRLFENKKRSMIRSLFSNAVRLIYMKKFEEAKSLLETCCQVGYAEGSYVLGCMHEFGLGTPTSRQRAFEYYNAAFDLGFRDPRQIYKLKILKMAR